MTQQTDQTAADVRDFHLRLCGEFDRRFGLMHEGVDALTSNEKLKIYADALRASDLYQRFAAKYLVIEIERLREAREALGAYAASDNALVLDAVGKASKQADEARARAEELIALLREADIGFDLVLPEAPSA